MQQLHLKMLGVLPLYIISNKEWHESHSKQQQNFSIESMADSNSFSAIVKLELLCTKRFTTQCSESNFARHSFNTVFKLSILCEISLLPTLLACFLAQIRTSLYLLCEAFKYSPKSHL